jgi:hypothetical protein
MYKKDQTREEFCDGSVIERSDKDCVLYYNI